MPMISFGQISRLYEKYLELIKLEVEEFGVKPTEVRHLIGRLGEFHCALEAGGTLAQTPNQHGFDVICPKGRKISVKTTAQKSGFVPISSKTASLADDLMVIQYSDGVLSTIYYGDMKLAIDSARIYKGNYELEIAKARALNQKHKG